jgi:hypothetical protein
MSEIGVDPRAFGPGWTPYGSYAKLVNEKTKFDSFFKGTPYEDMVRRQAKFKSLGRHLQADLSPSKFVTVSGSDVPFYASLKVFWHAMRPNALYRRYIARRRQEFDEHMAQLGLPPLDDPGLPPPTVIHIRRSDKVLRKTGRKEDRRGPSIDMREWCSSYRCFRKNMSCVSTKSWKDSSTMTYYPLTDHGCDTPTPFGALSLREYLDMAFALRPVKRALVLSDEPDWMEGEIKSIRSDNNHSYASWQIYYLSGRRPYIQDIHGRITHNAYNTENGAEFVLSLQLTKYGGGFVGGSVSNIFQLYFLSMCLHHGATSNTTELHGVCPPSLDLNQPTNPNFYAPP